jgi:hypothetical protein
MDLAIAREVYSSTFEANFSDNWRAPEDDEGGDEKCNQVIELVWHLENRVGFSQKYCQAESTIFQRVTGN